MTIKTLTINILNTADIDDKETRISLASKLYDRGKLTPELVADFVIFIYKKFIEQPDNFPTPKKKTILDSLFRGMWKDRNDVRDCTGWVRKIR